MTYIFICQLLLQKSFNCDSLRGYFLLGKVCLINIGLCPVQQRWLSFYSFMQRYPLNCLVALIRRSLSLISKPQRFAGRQMKLVFLFVRKLCSLIFYQWKHKVFQTRSNSYWHIFNKCNTSVNQNSIFAANSFKGQSSRRLLSRDWPYYRD